MGRVTVWPWLGFVAAADSGGGGHASGSRGCSHLGREVTIAGEDGDHLLGDECGEEPRWAGQIDVLLGTKLGKNPLGDGIGDLPRTSVTTPVGMKIPGDEGPVAWSIQITQLGYQPSTTYGCSTPSLA